MSLGLDIEAVSFDGIPTLDGSPVEELEDEKPKRRTRSDAGKPRGPRGPNSSTASGTVSKAASTKLATELLDPWAKLAKGLSFTNPTTSAVLISRGEATTSALVRIAEKHPRMYKALQNVGQIGPGTEIAETLMMVAVALQVDAGRMPPTHPIATAMGVGAIYREMFGEHAFNAFNTTDDGIEFQMAEMPATPGTSFEPVSYNRPSYDATNPQDPRFSFQAGQSRR